MKSIQVPVWLSRLSSCNTKRGEHQGLPDEKPISPSQCVEFLSARVFEIQGVIVPRFRGIEKLITTFATCERIVCFPVKPNSGERWVAAA